jgi:hypothetical protein
MAPAEPSAFGDPVELLEAHPAPTHALLVRDLDTGESAVVLTRPYRLGPRERWSWELHAVVAEEHRRRAAGG